MDISDFSSIYEVSIGFIAVGGFVQEAMRHQSKNIDERVAHVEHLKDALKTKSIVNDHIEDEIASIEPWISTVKCEMEEAYRFYQIWSLLSILIPIFFLFRIGLNWNEFPNPWAMILIAYSLGVGPLIIILSRRHFQMEVAPLIGKVDKLRRCAVLNRIVD